MAAELGMKMAVVQPFCALSPDLAKPVLVSLRTEAKLGNPVMEFTLQKRGEGKDVILAANSMRSAPCGSTWYAAKRMPGLEPCQSDLRERISEAHLVYLCSGSMKRDTELGDTVLHVAGYMIHE